MLASPNEPLPGEPIRASDLAAIIRYGRQSTSRRGARTMVTSGPGGQSVRQVRRFTPIPLQLSAGASVPFTFELYKIIKGTNAYLQVNGSDGLAAALNGIYANVNGNPNNVQIGSPLAWPLLSISSNGPVYAYVTLSTALGVTTVTQVDIFQEGSAQTPLTDAQTYAWILLGSVTNYATNGSGVPDFTLLNAQSTGFSQFAVCNGGYNVW